MPVTCHKESVSLKEPKLDCATADGTARKNFRMACFAGGTFLVVLVDWLTKTSSAPSMQAPLGHFSNHVLACSVGVAPLVVLLGVWAMVLLRRPVRCRPLFGLALALVVGGAVSNVAEAAVRGSVTDFIAVGAIATNIADLAMMAGTVCLLLTGLYVHMRTKGNASLWLRQEVRWDDTYPGH